MIKTKLINISFFIASITFLIACWFGISKVTNGDIPSPISTFSILKEILAEPYYDRGPNDKGIVNQLLSSLERVFLGFGIGSLVAIPLGLIMGSSKIAMKFFNPIVQILRPVSPLAWFPLGLLAFKAAEGATVFIIAITSLWPTLVNTSFGVASIPEDFKNVSRVFGFSTWKKITKVILPYSIPHIITGLKLSIGIAWMVIVAGEMLSGGMGIGFFVWDSWNALSLEKILIAILIIGVVGLMLDKAFSYLLLSVSYDKK